MTTFGESLRKPWRVLWCRISRALKDAFPLPPTHVLGSDDTAEVLQQLFFNPAIVVARLGSSATPLAAYAWAQPQNPRTDAETVVVPQWSLRVLTDGTVEPFLPAEM